MTEDQKLLTHKMERILVLGCSGAGKSTLTKVLSKELGIEALHTDTCYWSPGWVKVPMEQFKKAHNEFIKKDKWIVDGNNRATMPDRLELADTIIYLDFSTVFCLWSVIKRRFQYWGKTRPDVAEGCPEQFDWEFFKYIWSFNTKVAPPLKEMLSQQKDKKIIILKGRKEVNNFIENLKKDV